jgi:DNA (cytosine-5)-methyltransferase 1
LGRVHGFACQEQGNLFFKVAEILKVHRPPAFLLENVKNLKSHDRGKTFRIIMETLEDVLGYHVSYKIIDAKGFVPQHRERIFIAGFREDVGFNWDDFKSPSPGTKKMKDILHTEDGTELLSGENHYILPPHGKVNPKYTLSDHLWTYLQNYAKKHKAKGNGFGFGLVGKNDTARTLSARYYKDGSEILIDQGKKKNPRRLTPRECARLMGFPDEFDIPVSDTRAYKQFGNSVVVPVVSEIARIMAPHIQKFGRKFANELEVVLCSTGNPDHGQTISQSPEQRWRVSSLKQASTVCREYISEWNLGSGNWSGDSGKVFQNGNHVATIAYNGRILFEKTKSIVNG